MRRWLALACVATVCGCGSGPTAPTPDFVGNYSFVVEASSVCELPVERFDWNLVATVAGGGQNDQSSYLLTLPGGDPTLSLNLAYARNRGRGGQPQGDATLRVTLNAVAVPFGESLRVTINGSSGGTATVAPDGRGQIADGAINGVVRLVELVQPSPPPPPKPPLPPRPEPVGDCTAGDHRFTLTPQ